MVNTVAPGTAKRAYEPDYDYYYEPDCDFAPVPVLEGGAIGRALRCRPICPAR
ncbi:MAG: hypothetical protein IPG04_36835, partial [Polyangiaceae bacterium]|nr:hypothetical protein [Polyangiaceae bacterium]